MVELLSTSIEEEPLLLQALNQIINSRVLIRNSYGFSSYLKEQNNMYFLDDKVTPFADYLMANYSSHPLVTEKTTLEDLVEIVQLRNDKKYVCIFAKNATKDGFTKLSYRTKIILLEKMIELKYEGQISENINRLLDENINDRKFGEQTFAPFDIYTMSDGNLAHNLYNTEYTGSGYNVDALILKANGKIRIFDVESKTWEYVTSEKEKDYIEEIKELQKDKGKKAKNPYNIHGTIDQAGKFKIHDERIKGGKGAVCMEAGWSVAKLYALFHYIKHLPYDDEISSKAKGKKRKELLKLIRERKEFEKSPYVNEIDEMDQQTLEKLYTLFLMNKASLCGSLEKFLKGDNPENLNLMI